MSKIVCPKCHHEFDPNDNEISKLVDEEVKKRISIREKEVRELVEAKAETRAKELINKIDMLEEKQEEYAKTKILELKNSYEVEITNLKNQLKAKDNEKENEKLQLEKSYNEKVFKLKEDLSKADAEKKLAVTEAVNEIENKARATQEKLKQEIQYYKDFKTNLTVKEIGESLEQYCENKFNEQRMTSYPNAYFEKDNDLSVNKQKGDYIFRDYIGENDNRREIVSIMFDMKNEEDNSATKHKNEEFFKKLDSDRNAKKCEYAVLVSTLEADNQFYGGITDVSYKYPKMFVVRPQCFMAIISLIRNSALKAEHAQQELAEYKKQNIDVTNFENSMNEFKEGFLKNVKYSREHFQDAIKGIEDTIKKLEKTKHDLEDSMMQLGRANNKIQDLTMRRLTKNSPSLAEKLKSDKLE